MMFNKSKVYRLMSNVCGLRSAVFSLQSSVFSLRSKACRAQAAGFTLLELLVSMGILMVIVLMLANLFQQSTRAWNAGLHQTTIGLEARSVINMIQRDASMALPDPPPSGGGGLTFSILNDVGEIEQIAYGGGGSLTRNGNALVEDIEGFSVQVSPGYADITLELRGESRVVGVRAYAEGRRWNDPEIEDESDIVDTDREL